MIKPINQNLNINLSNNLQPVEVPHFMGKARNAKAPNKKPVNDTFKREAKKTLSCTKRGLKKGVGVITDFSYKTLVFTGAFFKSLLEDTTKFAEEKGAKTISGINSVI